MLSEIRDKIKEINNQILNHPFIQSAEKGTLPIDKIQLIYDQQWYIVNSDVKSLAIMLSKAKEQDEIDFFINALQGDYTGLKILRKVANKQANILPSAVSYTHYLAWLANYANTGEQVLALVVNLPIWSQNCRKLAEAYKGKINVEFLELFANSEIDEDEAEKIISRYDSKNYLEIAKMIQAYELSFWNSIY
ncbi:TenA family transcriptional regulator [Acidianus sulfidivorans JP7]|uniref:TenA family transcriptional regulator n=1 Tax=Acidianus sulfidivorans JP7 TaxID=619593 RepID=A0A2U9IPT8_9CREN|nr:TenA family transcriptional regulator [Acidianus sulfidivorans]AWR98068.1 TenA family transcriptional regulator [Acidianus sulfidivorans JP7]